jgi:glycosyltransferase involved in cell wall biosynthesis
MNVPTVSVMTITYNQKSYIVQAIEGILAQRTNFPFELVIGEDCSTDGTREIVFDYQRRYPDTIRVITSERNVGGKSNAIRTRKACRGKYLALCDGDDFWHHPDKLQKQVDFMESRPECGIVYSNYDIRSGRRGKIIRDFITYKKWKVPEKMSPRYFICNEKMSVTILTCTVLLRRDLCEKIIQADPSLHETTHYLMGDIQLWTEMSAAAEVGYIPESLATYNVSEESATRSGNVSNEFRFQASLCELMIYLSRKYGMPDEIIKGHEKRWYETSMRLACHDRDIRLADAMRSRAAGLNWKDWCRYYGAKYSVVHYGYRIGLAIKRTMIRPKKDWHE